MKADIWTTGEMWFVMLGDVRAAVLPSIDACIRYCQEAGLLYTVHYARTEIRVSLDKYQVLDYT